MQAPVPQLPNFGGFPAYYGIPSGRYVLIGPNLSFPLPVFAALEAGAAESNDQIHQAPGNRGGIRTGFGTDKPLVMDFGTDAASLNGSLYFDSEVDAIAWEREFLHACQHAIRIRDTVAGEEYDGWASKRVVRKNQRPEWRKLSLTGQALDPNGWQPRLIVVSGTPAVCVNNSWRPAYPYITLTAAGSAVVVSDSVRTLTVLTTAGHVVTIDCGRADGIVTDNGGLANYYGRFPRIEPGGSTLTVTGATDVITQYRQAL